MTELQILIALKNNNGSMDYTGLLNLGKADPVWNPCSDKVLVDSLLAEKILSGTAQAYGLITFGEKGRLRLQELEQIAQERTQESAERAKEKKSQFRHDWAIAIFSSLVGALLSDPMWCGIRFVWDLIASAFR